MLDQKRELARLRKLRDRYSRAQEEEVLKRMTFLPSQAKILDAYHDPKISICIFTGPNQVGKTHILGCNLVATLKGYEPWSNLSRLHTPPVKVAILLRDYDNHARTLLLKIQELLPADSFKLDRTQQGAPRVIKLVENGSSAHIFTHDQDVARLEGGTWHELMVDEPCPRSHFVALQRGLSFYNGKILMFMTPLSEPWIFDELYDQAGNNSGERAEIFAVTAFPDENLKSNGGYLDDAKVMEFRRGLSREEQEARVHGRWMHLIGRVHKQFRDDVHIIDEPFLDLDECCHGVSVDPHDRLPFAITWFAVTPGDDVIFYQEWPNEPFETMKQCDFTVADYVSLMNEYRSTVWRLMDPNYGRRKSLSSGLSIADEFAIRGIAFDTTVNDDIAAGHKKVQELLSWDEEKDISAFNQPKLYVTRNCRNIIKSFHNYVWDDWRGKIGEGKSAKQTPKEQYKHFMDCIRYVAMARVRYINPLGQAMHHRERQPLRRGHEGGDRSEKRALLNAVMGVKPPQSYGLRSNVSQRQRLGRGL